MKFLRFLNDHLEEYLLVFLMVVEVVVVFAQVVTRYVFHSPLAWSEELARYMFIWLVWIGAAYATKMRKNIIIDVVCSKFKENVKLISEIINFVLSVVLMLFMLWTTSTVMMQVYESNSIGTGTHLPMWIVWLSLPLSMALNLLRYTQNFVYDLKHWNDRKEEAQ